MNKLAEVEGLLYTRSDLLLHCVSTESVLFPNKKAMLITVLNAKPELR